MVSLRRLIGAAAVSCALVLAQGTSALAQTIEPPKLVTSAEVAYPEGAHGDGVVRLLLLVIEDGTVLSAATEEGEEPFASAAASAARGFRYAPATRGGKPVRARIRIEVRFTEPTPPPEDDPTLAPQAAAPKRASEPDEEVRVRGVRVEPGRTAEVEAALKATLSGVTGLVVAHRASTVLLADRVAMLVEGRIAHVGTHQELLATVPEYRELLSADYGIEPDLAEEALR